MRDITQTATRTRITSKATEEAIAASVATARSNVIARMTRSLESEGKQLRDITAEITSTNIDGEVAKEEKVLESWAQGFIAGDLNESGKYSKAHDFFKQAYDAALTQSDMHKNFNAPRSLYYMAKARSGEFDEKNGHNG